MIMVSKILNKDNTPRFKDDDYGFETWAISC